MKQLFGQRHNTGQDDSIQKEEEGSEVRTKAENDIPYRLDSLHIQHLALQITKVGIWGGGAHKTGEWEDIILFFLHGSATEIYYGHS